MSKSKISVDRILRDAARDQVLAAVDDLRSPSENAGNDENMIEALPEEIPGPQEKVLDSLLATCPRSEGFYLKLYKELPNNKSEYKCRIDDYAHWSDMEDEVANIVRENTLKNSTFWGSGGYKVHIYREGRNGLQKPIQKFNIDASDQEDQARIRASAPASINDEITRASGLIKAAKELFPSSPSTNEAASTSEIINSVKSLLPSPEATQATTAEMNKMLAEAFTKGMELAREERLAKATDSNQTMQMMMQMMTAMITATMSGKQNAKSEFEMFKEAMDLSMRMRGESSSFKENLLIMKELGMLSDKNPSATATVTDKFEEVKKVVSLAGDLAGLSGGEKSTALDKVIDLLVPKVPDMVANITGSISNYADAVKARQHGPMNNAARSLGVPGNAAVNTTKEGDDTMLFGFHPLFKELYNAIETHDRAKFPYITEKIKGFLGDQLIKDIVIGVMTAEQLSTMIQQYGGYRFKDQMFVAGKMLPFLNEYVLWVRGAYDVQPVVTLPDSSNNTPAPPLTHIQGSEYLTACSQCGDRVVWSSQQSFEADSNHVCGLQTAPNKFCEGILAPISTNTTENIEGSVH